MAEDLDNENNKGQDHENVLDKGQDGEDGRKSRLDGVKRFRSAFGNVSVKQVRDDGAERLNENEKASEE